MRASFLSCDPSLPSFTAGSFADIQAVISGNADKRGVNICLTEDEYRFNETVTFTNGFSVCLAVSWTERLSAGVS